MKGTCFVCILCLTVAFTTFAAEETTPFQRRLDAAVDRGIDYLIKRQRPDGSFGEPTDLYGGHPAVAALAGLAMIADGSTPQNGRHAEAVAATLDYLLKQTTPNGLIKGSEFQPMYGQGFAVLFLAECYGMSDRRDLKQKLEAAVDLIVRTQNVQGGWRYEPRQVDDADISVTITQLNALRAVKGAGLFVPNETIDKGVAFVKNCQNDDGGFRYRLELKESGFERTAAAISSLQSAGIYEGTETDRAFRFLERPAKLQYAAYGRYYAALAIWCAGKHSPIDWADWFTRNATELLDSQQPDGAWRSTISTDADTAMNLILLRIPSQYLPSLQK